MIERIQEAPSSIYAQSRYPVFLDLTDKRSVVIGAGVVAERKIGTLLEYGAAVHVIAPQATECIEQWAADGSLTFERRAYAAGDCVDAFLVICAVGVREVDQQVYAEACAHETLVNVVDVPHLCNFIVPSIVKRGPLQIAISTSGAAPTVAKQIRRDLEQRYPQDWADYLILLGELRTLVIARVDGGEERRKPLFEAVSEAGILERMRAGEQLDAERIYSEIIIPLLDGGEGR